LTAMDGFFTWTTWTGQQRGSAPQPPQPPRFSRGQIPYSRWNSWTAGKNYPCCLGTVCLWPCKAECEDRVAVAAAAGQVYLHLCGWPFWFACGLLGLLYSTCVHKLRG